MFTKEEIQLLQTALNTMVINAPVAQQAKFYAEKVIPLIKKLEGMKEEKKEAMVPVTETKSEEAAPQQKEEQSEQ